MSDIATKAPSSTPSSEADPAGLGVLEAAQELRAGRLSSVDLTEACLRRIEELGGGKPTFDGAPDRINAWVRLYPDLALDHAREADERRAREGGDAPLLCGIPIGLKDLYAVAGLPLTASSRVLEGNVASGDSPAWRSLRDRGMVLLGHTHMHEFAAGGTTDQVGNPHDLRLVAGGSSGGSAAALAARMTPAALGSDTCGSLRIPSACCGTSAIKPTHGRISLDGIVPLAPSLDHPGPMARTVADCAALLEAMADGTAAVTPLLPPPAPTGPLALAARAGPSPLDGVTIALTNRTREIPMHDEVARALQQAVNACERLGARIVERPAAWTLDPDDLSWVLMAEAWAYHRLHAERHNRYREQVAEFIEAARDFTDAQAYIAAQMRRAQGTAAWENWFAEDRIDALLEPTLPILPFERGVGYDRDHPAGPGDPMIALSALWDMTGMPVVSLPVSWSVGMSLVAPRGREAPLTQIAIDLQEHALGIPGDPGAPVSLAVTGALLAGERVGVRAEERVIVELGPNITPRPEDVTLDAAGAILVPGLINGHTHAAMTLFRGYGDDLPLMQWLEEKIWPVERKLEPEDVYWGTRLACLEMVRSGTVRFWDMYWHPEAAAHAVQDAGLRATVAAPLIDVDGRTESMRAAALRSLDELAGAGEEIDAALAPHAIYTVSEDNLHWIAELAGERGLPVQIHLSETEQEVNDCLAAHKLRPAHYLDRVGLLSPRTVLSHGVWLDESELELIAARGAVLVSNPVANLKLAVGRIFPYPAARAAGIQVGLGTDGPGSNNSLDMFADMKLFALLQKHAARDSAAVNAEETWEIATGRRAPLLGAAHGLAVGQPADFLLLRAGAPELSFGELPAALVYAASGAVVHSTVVAGRVLMRDSHIAGAEEVLARALERARRLGLAAPIASAQGNPALA